jgi:hypothetical protein
MTSSIAQTELEIDSNKLTAVIYSIDELGYFHLELHHHGKNYFVTVNDEPKVFHNINEAKKAALAEKAEIGYLALSATYQEFTGNGNVPLSQSNRRYDYQLISLAN